MEESLFGCSYFSLNREESKRFRDDYWRLYSLSFHLRVHESIAESNIAAKTAAEKGIQCTPLGVVGLGALTYAAIQDQNIGEQPFYILGLVGLGIVLVAVGGGALIGYLKGWHGEKKNQQAYQQLCEEINELKERLKAYEPKAVQGVEALKRALKTS